MFEVEDVAWVCVSCDFVEDILEEFGSKFHDVFVANFLGVWIPCMGRMHCAMLSVPSMVPHTRYIRSISWLQTSFLLSAVYVISSGCLGLGLLHSVSSA
jgi:hypothetical protein